MEYFSMKHEKLNCGFIFRAELKSGFQSLIINEIEIVMLNEKTNPKIVIATL